MHDLWNFQGEGTEQIYDKWRSGDMGVLYISPTGTGKTTVAAHITKHLVSNNKRVLFFAHRDELINQGYNKFSEYDLDIDVLHERDTGCPVAVSSIQSAKKLDLSRFDLLIMDEAHRSNAVSYTDVVKRYPDARLLGLTAYPYRLDGKPLGRASGGIWDSYVRTIKTQEAIERGYLVPFSYVCPKKQIDTKGLHKNRGEYNSKEQFSRANKRELYEGVAENIQQFGQTSTIVFCINREHAHNTCKMLQQFGFRAASLDSKTSDTERDLIYSRMKYRDLDVVCNCEIYVEGVDIQIVDTIVLNLKTASMSKYLQMGGRGSRVCPPVENKTKNVIIDMGGNWLKHGYLEQDFPIDLNKERKKKGDAPLKICDKCRAIILASSRICQNCGFEFPFDQESDILSKGDFVEFGIGDLTEKKKKVVKIKKSVFIPKHLRKQYTMMSDDELQEFATIKEYKPGWVWKMKSLRR